MNYLKIFFITLFFLSISNFSNAKDIVFLSMQKILNESKAGKKAQDSLKKQISEV